ncbi:MAG: hypothetical protein BWY52_01958 [Chloroflexi bacterium ADurb.Bin325]|nr:MAG: hypothetical protein BWY52_01958 [Chloroflexi bacterium ADurb.Bin325]
MHNHANPSTCEELIQPLKDAKCPKPYDKLVKRCELHAEFWDFASFWVERASPNSKVKNPVKDPDPFKTLIYLWVAFNGWATQIVQAPNNRDLADAIWVAALGQDPTLNQRFDAAKQENSDFAGCCSDFVKHWPVFQVSTLHRLKIPAWASGERRNYVEDVMALNRAAGAKGAKNRWFSPPCYERHKEEAERTGSEISTQVLNNWPHILSAIYKVRCNLFHGGKTYQSAKDWWFVSSAYKILWRVWSNELPDWLRDKITK